MKAMRPAFRNALQAAITSICLVTSGVTADAQNTLKTGGDVLSMPSIGRVVGGFVLTVALAIAIVYALKRYLPSLSNRFVANKQSVVKANSGVQNGLRYHILEIDEHKVLVVEGKSGIALAVLSAAVKQVDPTL